MLQAIDLTKRYEDGQLALDSLNLEIKPGEIFFLLGANGAGKTTAINLFLNFINPTSGKALINGMDVTEQPMETKKHVAFVQENVMLYGNYTARQNLDFFARLGGKTNLTKKDYYNTMREIGLQEDVFEKKLKTFSIGMRQKIGLAIAIIKGADNLLLDEPTSGLDPKSASELMQMLVGLRNTGKAILMCSDDIFRAKAVADRVGIMKEGRLVILRSREEFLRDDLEKIYMDYMLEVGVSH